MSDKPVWMEDILIAPDAPPESGMRNLPYYFGTFTPEQAKLFAASPALVRALLLAEWADNDDEDCCPVCGELKPAHDQESTGGWTANGRPCALDAALTLAGFTDQASRDAAREMIRKETK